MRMLIFGKRTAKEIITDPLNLSFGLGLPVILLILFSVIQANVPVDIFAINQISPGIVVFSLSFMTLFTGILIAKDRESVFLDRLLTSPLTVWDFVLGYTIPLIFVGLAQSIVCYIVALCFGLEFSINIIISLVATIPMSLLFIGLGLLFGSIMNVKQVSGISGGLLVNVTGLLSGCWFDLSLLGDGFHTFALCLPFANGVDLQKALLNSSYTNSLVNFLVVMAYVIVVWILAVICFKKQMKK